MKRPENTIIIIAISNLVLLDELGDILNTWLQYSKSY